MKDRPTSTIKRLVWEEESRINENGRLVKSYSAYNRKEELLGFLIRERLGRFLHWMWYQEEDVSMSAGCLDEVRDKQKKVLRG